MSAPLNPSDSVGQQFWRATLRWQRCIASALKPLGLTHVQYVLLASIWWLTHMADEQPSQRRIAEHAGTDPMMTSQVLRALSARGFVVREPDPLDARALTIGITAEGVTLALRAMRIVEAADEAFFGTVEDTTALTGALRDLAEWDGPRPTRLPTTPT